MAKFEEKLPSLRKMKSDLVGYKLLGTVFGKRNEVIKLESQYNDLINITNKFSEYFSEHGWAIYSLLSTKVMESAVSIFESKGIDEAEKVLIDYYADDQQLYISRLNSVEEFSNRYNLLNNAFKDHIEGRYYASVPLLLIIVDGVVNDYTKKKGLFTDATDVSAWDCMVGAEEGLEKLKNIFNRSRKKTTTEEIKVPYRNGILHGRDLNYGTALVSSKCIGLVFAVYDWICRKNDEDMRKEKYQRELNPPNWGELLSNIRKNKDDKKAIQEWKSIEYIIGEHFPDTGDVEDFKDVPFLIPVIEFFNFWKNKNYGNMAKVIDHEYRYESNPKLRPKLCRQEFGSRILNSFKLLEVEDRAIELKRVKVDVEWMLSGEIKKTELEFGIVFQGEDEKTIIPSEDNGKWVLIPWNLGHLYNI